MRSEMAVDRKMASTSNPLEEILNSDVADSPFSSLVPPIQPPVSPAVARVDDRPNHRNAPSTAAAAVVASPVMSQTLRTSSASSAAIQSALLYNHRPVASVSTAAASSKDFNGSSSTVQAAMGAVGSRGPAINIPVRTEGAVAALQTVANPTAASFAQSLGNFLNAAQFRQSNITGAGLSTDQKPLVTNIGAMSALGSTVPAQVQVVSPLRPSHPVASNLISVKPDATQAVTNLKPFAVTRQPPLTVGQQTLVTGQQQQQQHMTLIQSSSPAQGTVGFPSQHVQIVNVPTQNVQRTSVAPMSNLRTLAPRIAINQPVRIQQQPGQNIPMIRPQNVVAQQISFAPGVQQNLLQGNMVLIKNERGQMMLLQNPGQPQQPSASNSPVIQSALPSQARPQLSGQLGLVQTTVTGQGLTMVSSAPTQFIQPTVAATVRISSTGQGLVPMQSAVPMLTQPRQQTGLHSVALSTPSIMSRLVPQSSVAQTNATPLASPASGTAIGGTYMKEIQENVRKCKNFLSTLMKLASNQPDHVVNNVKNLIQGLIDGIVEPEDFTNQLQKELKSSPQPYLVPFLRKSLPFLRHSLVQNKMTIDGIRPPPASVATVSLSLATTVTAAVPIFSVASSMACLRPRPAVIPNSLTSKSQVPTILTPQQQQLRLSMIQQQQQQHSQLSGLRMVGPKPTLAADHTKAVLTRPALFPLPPGVNTMHLAAPAPLPTSTVTGATIISNGLLPQINSGLSAAQQHKGEKRKYEALRDDDDINDVATMGGVNLTEESRNILATNSELVSGQLRSCKDEKLLEIQILMQRINDIAQHKGLDTVSQEVASAVSHAVQDHLRTLIEQLSLYVTHRLENYRLDPRFEAANDRRTQLKFLEDLGSIERKRHEEAERGVLMRAARSRAKAEDPEQAKLKERAKAMQQAEMEEIRQRESNLTALAAIGPRRPRTAQDTAGSVDSGSPLNKTIVPLRPRIKRVNLRDLLFLLEQRRESRRSMMLYKAFLK